MDGTAVKFILVICPHEVGTWDPNYTPGVDFLDMGLADLLGIADLHCRKVESTKWLKHKLRATLGGQ